MSPNYRGQVVKTLGDGFLIRFDSALSAVECAIQIQQQLDQRNRLASEDSHILLRIGIHVGDVIHRGGDVFRDNVNIATRLYPLAEPGGICMSSDVERQVRNKVNMPLVKLGPNELKHIQEPMEVWRIQLPWETPASSSGRMNPFHPALSGLTEFDSFILMRICQVVLEQGDFRFELWSVTLWDTLKLNPAQRDEFYESLEILSTHGYISGEKGLRSPGIMVFKVRHSTIESYLRNSCEDYDLLFEQVVHEIVVNGARKAATLADKFQRPGILIAHMFGVLENNSRLTLVRPLRGNFVITNISAELKRSVRRG
ncbi:MAG: adenylate/guanylate cyclase domain-containing protein [Verrucomicrobia bacterium]|nr:adenylate/guanylate cyclase domain-containing protein [Verrucomicrobiota bacterium]